jgi:hypothetical protein
MEREGVPIYTAACLRQPYNATDGKNARAKGNPAERGRAPNEDARGPTRRAPYVAPRSADFERA